MGIQNQRVFISDNGDLTEVSDALNDFRGSDVVIPLVTSEDKIYIASDLPFNSRFVVVTVANDVTAVVTVELRFNNAWVPAVDVLDRTVTGGKSLTKSGFIQWQPDENKGWDKVARASDVTELSTLNIFGMYWARLSWSGTLKATTSLRHIGYKFSTDAQLQSYYPDLGSDLMAAFATGKMNWDDQHFMAAEAIIADLRRRQILASRNQIMDWELFTVASCHKAAEVIYRGLGRSYVDDATAAHAAYEEALDVKFPALDTNADGRLSMAEKTQSTGWLKR